MYWLTMNDFVLKDAYSIKSTSAHYKIFSASRPVKFSVSAPNLPALQPGTHQHPWSLARRGQAGGPQAGGGEVEGAPGGTQQQREGCQHHSLWNRCSRWGRSKVTLFKNI